MITSAEVANELRRTVPEMAGVIDAHLTQDGELLPHVLFGEVTRFVVEARERGDDRLVEGTLAFLDRCLEEGDDEVRDLVAVSFVDNIGSWDQQQRAFIDRWPSALRAEASRQRRWRPGNP